MALLGPVLLDLGWLCLFADRGAGVELGWRRDMPPLTPDEIVSTCSEGAGFAVSRKELN
jgi:hypothetical protein